MIWISILETSRVTYRARAGREINRYKLGGRKFKVKNWSKKQERFEVSKARILREATEQARDIASI